MVHKNAVNCKLMKPFCVEIWISLMGFHYHFKGIHWYIWHEFETWLSSFLVLIFTILKSWVNTLFRAVASGASPGVFTQNFTVSIWWCLIVMWAMNALVIPYRIHICWFISRCQLLTLILFNVWHDGISVRFKCDIK